MNDNVKKALLDGSTTIQTELEILGVNLLDINNCNILRNSYINTDKSVITQNTTENTLCLYIPIIGGKTYYLYKKYGSRFRVGTTVDLPAVNVAVSNVVNQDGKSSMTVKTSESAKYLVVYYYNGNYDKDYTEKNVLNTIKIYDGESIILNEKNGVVSWDYEDFRHVKDEGFIGQFIARKVNGTIKNISDDFNMTDKEFILKMGVNVYPDYERIYLNEDSDGKYRLIGNSTQETRSGDNLYNFKNISTVSNTATTDKNGWITMTVDNSNGETVRYCNYWTKNLDLKANTKYNIIMEVKKVTGTGAIRSFNYYNNDGQFNGSSYFTFDSLSDGVIKQNICTTKESFDSVSQGLRTYAVFNAGQSGSITFRLSVLEDISVTPETFKYEQYGASPSPDFPSEIVNTLNQGTYQTYLGNDNYIFDLPVDLAGIGDVKNELVINKENGTFEFTENIGKVVLDGSETIVKLSQSINTYKFKTNLFSSNNDNLVTYTSDKFKPIKVSDRYQDKTFFINQDGDITISFNEKTTLEDFKTWLSENPVTVYYQLATPNVITGTLTKKEYDTTWYTLGNFLVTKVTDDEVNDKTTFEALDYTKRFNQRYNDTVTYPCTAIDLARNVCEQCGCELGSTSFKNSDFEIKGNVFTNGETCRDVMKQIGKLAFSWVRVDLDNKVYIDFTSNKTVDEYNKIDNSKYYTLKTQKEKIGAINRVVIGYKDIEGERTKLEDTDDITANGVHEITVFDNPLVYNQELREKVIKQAQDLIGLEYMPMEILTVGHPWLKGDELLEVTDMEGKVHKTIPLDRTIQYFGHIKTKINVGTNTKTNTELAYDSGVGGRLRRTEIIVNKIDGTISEILEYQDETTKKLNETISSVDETKQTISKVETKVEDITTTTITSSGGNSLHLTEAMESNALDYKIDGNSYQEVRSGKNLLSLVNGNQTKNGITMTIKDGVISLNGTSTNTTEFTFDLSLDNADYILYMFDKVVSSNPDRIRLLNGNSEITNIYFSDNVTQKNFANAITRFDILIANNRTYNNYIIKPMITTTETEIFEQYGASPSPDYPSEVEVVKGYNLFDKDISMNNGYINSGGVYTDADNNCVFDFMSIEKGIYTFYVNNIVENLSVNFYDNTQTFISRQHILKVKLNTFAVPDNCKYIRLGLNYDGVTKITKKLIDTLDLQLIKGIILKPYVPYKNIGIKTTGKNLCDGINQNYYLNTACNKSGKGSGDTGLAISTNGATKFTVSTKITQSRFRVACTNELPTDDFAINVYNGLNHDGKNQSMTIDTTGYKYLIVNATDLNEIMIEQGSVATPCEPYQENITYIDLKKNNLFDKDNANILDVYISSSTQIIGNSSNDKCLYIPIVGGKTYTILKTLSKIFRVGFTDELPEKGVVCNPYIGNNNVNSITVISNTNNKYLVVEYWVNTDTLSAQEILDSIKIYEGAEAEDSWEICEKDSVKAKDNLVILTKRIGKVVLDGSETIVKLSQSINTYKFKTNLFSSNNDNLVTYTSDKFKPIKVSDRYQDKTFFINQDGDITISFNEKTTLEDFKTWLSENPVTVYYQLANPYEVSLKPTNIPLFEGINNVSLLSTLDTNTYIKYLRKTPLSDDYATNQQLNQTNENLANTDNKTSLNATEINNTNNKLNNDYYNKTQVDAMNTTTENRITQIENAVETTKTATDYQISILQKQLEDGVTILDTKTGYVFDKDGLKISKSDSEMNSQLDHDGLIIKRNDTEVLSVRSDGVVTENLKVKTYFTIGKNTRVEDYKDGTGFFYIGGAE